MSTPTASATPLVAPSPTDGGAARDLRDRYAANGSLAGLAEDPAHRDEKLDSDGVACGRPLPLLDRRLVAVTHVFGTPDGTEPEEFVELAQETVVYPTDAVAAQAVRRLFDLFDTCDRDMEAGQVTDGHAAADLPAGTGMPGRAVTATMRLPDGTLFPHRYGCLHHGRVVQCVAVWTRSKGHTAAWFEKAIIATGQGLRG
ncbi:hypothetical protein [Micromonospora sp. NPDC005299]|uniref:hypothetical protein n=1 Tax=Micromonospora sp. NPDC005299 TaxID=3364231 RepID=UPI0036953060